MTDTNKDREFEEFVLKQVLSYADSNKKASYAYILIAIAAGVMAVLAVFLKHAFLPALVSLGMAAGFLSARNYYIRYSSFVYDVAEKIEDALADPDFKIPDDYSEEVMGVRDIVLPTSKNMWSQVLAYGIIAASCYLGGVIIAAVSGPWSDDFSIILFSTSFILFGMAIVLTALSVKAARNLKMAGQYSDYLKSKEQ